MNRRTASRADTRRNSKYALFALIGLILSPLTVAYAESSPPDRMRSCGLFDYEQWRRDHPRPAGKRLADRNVGPPRTVRMIYFLPNDHPFRQEVVDLMKVRIREIQTFYAEQMQAHGYGRRTFRFETDAQGEPLVHRVDGRYPNSHYLLDDTFREVFDEIEQVFSMPANVYLIVIDTTGAIRSGGDPVGGVAKRLSKSGGMALVSDSVWFDTAAHELGHAFGLDHDFRDDAYIMSYGSRSDRLSACAAEFLSVNPHFNRNSSHWPVYDRNPARPTGQLISSVLYPPGSTSVPIPLKIASSKGLHQVILQGETRQSHSAAGTPEVLECRGFAGQKETVARFEYDGTIPSSPLSNLSDREHGIFVTIVDVDGNGDYIDFSLTERSPYLVATLRYEDNNKRFIDHSLSFSPDGSLLATVSVGKVLLWDVASRQQIATLQQEGGVSSLSFSPDGSLLAIRSGYEVSLWDVASRQQIATLQQEGGVSSLSFSPDGSLLAIGSGYEVSLWDVASRQQIATLRHEGGGASSLSFSPDGSLLAIGLRYEVSLWDVASRQQIATLQQEGGAYKVNSHSLSFSPDGSLLATVSVGKVLLWDVASRQQIATLRHEGGGASSLSFSPDGSLLAVGSIWGVWISLWDVASRQQTATLYEPQVSSISFSPDGSLLAAVSESDKAAWLWDMSKVAVAQTPHSLTKVSGAGQAGPARVQLAAPFVVSALNQDGSPLSGVRVTFSVTAGGGLLSPTSDADPCAVGSSASSIAGHTDANGQASARLTLGSEPGTNIVEATVDGLEPATFTATAAEQAIPHRLTKVCGDSQEGLVDKQLDKPFVVSVSAETGAALAGVVVSFAVTAGEGTLSLATSTTDANGRAATKLTLGSESGTNTVEAAVEGLGSVTFTATGEKSALASLFDAFGGGKRASLPDRTQLLQNAPNPFNSQTVLSYFLLEPGSARLEVFSLTGQRVAVLHQGPQQAGYHRLHWDGRDNAGRPVASGAYLYRLVTDEAVLTRKLILLR